MFGRVTHQVAITVVAPVRAEAAGPLRALLAEMGRDPGGNGVVPFAKQQAVHFARLVLLEGGPSDGGHPRPPRLVLIIDADAPVRDRLLDLVDTAEGGLDQLFEHCEEYPAVRTRARRLAYLHRHAVPSAARYTNTIGRTMAQVRLEAAVRESIQAFLDRPGRDWSAMGALESRGAIRRFVAADRALRPAMRPAARPGLRWRVGEWLHIVQVVAIVLAAAPFALLAAPAYVATLRLRERRDPAPHVKATDAHIRELLDLEDRGVSNQFTAVGPLKPGRFRRWTASAVLWGVDNATRHYFNRNDLAGVDTIHAARWVFLDDGRELLFASNYDGSLESYMDDFIDRVAWGLNAVFSNGVGYPRTNWLIRDGAKDEQAFKDFIRIRQVPSQVWYNAHAGLTTANIERNARIRAGLRGRMDEPAAAAWLRLL